MELKTIGTKVKRLFDGGEDRGVSPVIGVILMVAITVILAAVIGAFVLGLGGDLDNSSGPSAQIGFENNETTAGDIRINHNGGDELDLDEFTLVVDGSNTTALPSQTLSGGEYVDGVSTGTTGEAELRLRHDPSGNVIGTATIDVGT